jgi:hypothetical protein
MKKYLKTLNDFLFNRTRKAKIVNYSICGLLAIYLILLACPNLMFGHSFTYKNFNIHSTQPLGDNIRTILVEAEIKLSASEIYDKNLTQNIYLCNNYTLYSFFAPLKRKAFACNYPIMNNIFIANCDIDKNEASKNDNNDQYTRQLSVVISHEATHTLIEKKIGFWKFITLSNWKNEGYCDYVGYGQTDDLKEGQKFLVINKNVKKPGTDYRKYYIAVNYLMTFKKMTFDNLLSTDLAFEKVLKQVETER